MAEDIRPNDHGSIEERREAIVAECDRQRESCLYTSTTLYIWLRSVRRQRQFFIAAPLILGGIAGISVLKTEFAPNWLIAVLAWLASALPALADALKIETNVNETARIAAEYKTLQDRFRRLGNITVLGDVGVAEQQLAELIDRLDIARSTSLTPPESAFKKAQRKIASGDYDFRADAATSADIART